MATTEGRRAKRERRGLISALDLGRHELSGLLGRPAARSLARSLAKMGGHMFCESQKLVTQMKTKTTS